MLPPGGFPGGGVARKSVVVVRDSTHCSCLSTAAVTLTFGLAAGRATVIVTSVTGVAGGDSADGRTSLRVGVGVGAPTVCIAWAVLGSCNHSSLVLVRLPGTAPATEKDGTTGAAGGKSGAQEDHAKAAIRRRPSYHHHPAGTEGSPRIAP